MNFLMYDIGITKFNFKMHMNGNVRRMYKIKIQVSNGVLRKVPMNNMANIIQETLRHD